MPYPKVIFFSGFLGSGKTTLASVTARLLTDQGKKLTIIINDAASNGVDEKYLKSQGYPIEGLSGGCICCSQAAEIGKALDKARATDCGYILIEPSGTASPSALLKVLKNSGCPENRLFHITLVDPLRAEAHFAVLEPFFATALPIATAAVIPKIDMADAAMLAFARKVIRDHNPEIPVFEMDLQAGLTEGYAGFVLKL
ncbi:MAG: GTP-binding protein [Eubacterium sp.]|nr:GTP-binding protein [Eubacterium sp.]